MTQTSAPPAAGPGHRAAPAPGAPAPGTRPAATPGQRPPTRGERLRASLRRTPGRLRIALVVAVLAALAAGLLGFQAASVQARALAAAEHDTSQLVDVQEARNTLVAADAVATNAFLVGGLEPVEQRERYDAAIAAASALLTDLASRNAQDAEQLGVVAASLTEYVELVSQARANNRQGFPVGSGYLDQASATLRTEALPALDALVVANADRVASDFSSVRGAMWILAAGLVALAALFAVQVWLARRTHRVLNVGLASATGVLLVAGILGAVLLGQASSTASSVRSGPYAATLAASQAYSLANDAKSMESFTLIKRGSGQAYEEAFVEATNEAEERLQTAVDEGILGTFSGDRLVDWVDRHAEVRALDDAGDWDGAVELATSTEPDTPNAAFEAFSEAVRGDVAAQAGETRDQLSSARTASTVTAWVLLLAGAVAAVLAWRGVSVRLEEYR